LAEHRLDELRSLIRKSCDLAYYCGVQESFRRTADRGSTSSPPGISSLQAEPAPSKPANLFGPDQPCLSGSGNLARRRNRVVLDRLPCGL
jgi:hypothetical protein